MSSIASSTVANGLSVRVSAVIVTGASYPAGAVFSTYLASTSISRLTWLPPASSDSVVSASVCGIRAIFEAGLVDGGDGQRHTLERNRPLLDEIPEQLASGSTRTRTPSASGVTEATRPTPSTCPWT